MTSEQLERRKKAQISAVQQELKEVKKDALVARGYWKKQLQKDPKNLNVQERQQEDLRVLKERILELQNQLKLLQAPVSC